MIRRPATRRSTRTTRATRLGLALTGVLVFAGGCVSNAKQDSLKPRGTYAHTIYNLVWPVFLVGGVVMVIVLGGTLYFAARYRVPTDTPTEGEEFPPQIHGHFGMELGWTITPAVILLVVGVATVMSIFKLAEAPPKSAPHVEVIGQQWWWEFRYDVNHDGKYDEVVTANELVIPADTKVALRMVSRDVIHGFWAPELNGKRDTVPGHPTEFNIAADDPGTYYGQCTVMCGLSHANMRFRVVALPRAEYDKWIDKQVTLAKQPTDPLAKEGSALFVSSCGGCHSARGIHTADPKKNPLVAGEAPDLTHLMSRTIFASGVYDLRIPSKRCIAKGLSYANDPTCINEAMLRAWLHDPEALLPQAPNGIDGKPGTIRGMPNLQLSPTAIDQLVAFLETLK